MKATTETLDSKIIMRGVHFELTLAMKNIIREKFAAILRHNDRIIRINVRLALDQTLGREHHFSGTAQVEIAGPDLIASAYGKDAYAVIDGLADTLDRLVERRHDRRKDERNHPHDVEIDSSLPKAG
jgi:putative sigma-54 modulation protein